MSRARKNNVVLIVGEIDKSTDGGILLPGSKINTEEMEVYMVGPDVTDIKVGDTVVPPDPRLFTSKRGIAYDMELEDGRKCIIVEEDDIRFVLTEHNPVVKREMPATPRKGPIQKRFDKACLMFNDPIKAVFLGKHTVDLMASATERVARFDRGEMSSIDTLDSDLTRESIKNIDALKEWIAEDDTC